MPDPQLEWQMQPTVPLPLAFTQAVEAAVPEVASHHVAQLLWQRGIQDPAQIPGFLDPDRYQPTTPFAFGDEMHWAVERLQQARENQESVAIWGDFDADGVTATAVLWDGLGQFFAPHKLVYYIPNRLTESHGLSRQGLDLLHAKGCRLIVTCDTGSTNREEIDYAHSLGMDVIVTDHHTLPDDRPPVTAIINPRYLPTEHPLATLSGVAVAYKLVEALYLTFPAIPQRSLEYLLDLVAIGLVADLVELRGDCRYLAQRGIEQLQKQSNPATATRPGVAKLLELCKRSGDRPTDISFGLGPRINAVSRIQGDAHFCVELLTSQDINRCNTLAEATELANARRKELQKDVLQQVSDRLAQLDRSTTGVIVLADAQWQVGVLGLVAGQIAQTYGRPTILLSLDESATDSGTQQESQPVESNAQPTNPSVPLARGSARSANRIDLYQLVRGQQHLLCRFGGHPFAAGLSLPVENIPLFTEAINQQWRQTADTVASPALTVDRAVTVAELGKTLFQALKRLEPCGMGNPVPKLLIQNVWFERVWNRKIQDSKGKPVQYIKTEFALRDDSTPEPFPGVWWGHYKEDIPQGRCDVVVELDFNTYTNEAKGIKPHYEVRLLALRPSQTLIASEPSSRSDDRWLLDWRGNEPKLLEMTSHQSSPASPLLLRQCPTSWHELQIWYRRAEQENRPLAIAYPPPTPLSPPIIWQQLVGIAKYLSRTGSTATRQQLVEKLGIGDRALQLGFQTLTKLGFTIHYRDQAFQLSWQAETDEKATALQDNPAIAAAMKQFFTAVQEEQFQRQYFYQVPLTTLQAVKHQ